MVTLTSDPALRAPFLYKSWAGRRTHETKCCDCFSDVTSPAAVTYQVLCFIRCRGGADSRARGPRRARVLSTEPALQAESGGDRVRQACGCHTPELRPRAGARRKTVKDVRRKWLGTGSGERQKVRSPEYKTKVTRARKASQGSAASV